MKRHPKDKVIANVAITFAATLRWDLGVDTMTRVVAENARRRAAGDTTTCATHDHCDANMNMAEAFDFIVGRHPDPAQAADAEIINAAWERAIADAFYLGATVEG